MKKSIRTTTLTALGLVAMMLAGCASAAGGDAPSTKAPKEEKVAELRLGYFANVTHAPALVGVSEGLFQKELGDVTLKTAIFNAGPAAIEALSAGAIDAAYVGPNPAINTFIQSGGASAHVIAGATSGGAALVVRDGINSAADLKGKTIATPQLGNTQDVALRSWLDSKGLKTTIAGGGDVKITPTENAQTLTLFQQGQLDGAWLPEPWVSRLVVDAGAKVLVDEKDLWKNGAFPTTVLLVSADFEKKHPSVVKNLLKGHIAAVNWLNKNAAKAPTVINAALEKETGKKLSDAVIARSLKNVKFTVDPVAGAFKTLVKNGVAAGTQKTGSIDGLFNLTALNELLKKDGEATVSAGGLGKQ